MMSAGLNDKTCHSSHYTCSCATGSKLIQRTLVVHSVLSFNASYIPAIIYFIFNHRLLYTVTSYWYVVDIMFFILGEPMLGQFQHNFVDFFLELPTTAASVVTTAAPAAQQVYGNRHKQTRNTWFNILRPNKIAGILKMIFSYAILEWKL